MENSKKPSLEQILGKQAIALLNNAGIYNLKVENNGSISGEQQVVRGLPQTDYIKNISIRIDGGKIVIGGEITNSVTDLGKII